MIEEANIRQQLLSDDESSSSSSISSSCSSTSISDQFCRKQQQQQQQLLIATSLSKTMDHDTTTNNNNDNEDDDDEDWEEWDGSSPFWIHCTAGSIAGVIEHTATYPLDTVRTHIQVCAACIHRATMSGSTAASSAMSASSSAAAAATRGGGVASSSSSSLLVRSAATATANSTNLPLGMWQTIRYLVNESLMAEASSVSRATAATASIGGKTSTTTTTALNYNTFIQGWGRLWRGVQTVLIGCIPAHALYFSSYEFIKQLGTAEDPITGKKGTLSPIMSSVAGAVATFGHDVIMTPLDTIKQRMQLGHHTGIIQAITAITKNEGGYSALYRSFPVTLASNIPYGMIMVTTNETCKSFLLSYHQQNKIDTNNYDGRIRLSFADVVIASSIAGFVASAVTTPLDRIKTALQTQQLAPNCIRGRAIASCYAAQQQGASAAATAIGGGGGNMVVTKNWYQAVVGIYTQEGLIGFFRGFTPRVLSHTPAVAISWTTYETVKQYLLVTNNNNNQ